MSKFKITQEQVDILKRAASMESVPHIPVIAVILEPGIRHNTNDRSRPDDMNIALVSDDSDWNDTDLSDYGTWSDFRKGIELTPDGRGIVDFYIRRRGDEYHELHGNVVLYIANHRMSFIDGYGHPDPLWRREGGFRS